MKKRCRIATLRHGEKENVMMTAKEIQQKYQKSYHLPPKMTYDWVKKECITKAPIWCSVDLRDGNQALIEPMD